MTKQNRTICPVRLGKYQGQVALVLKKIYKPGSGHNPERRLGKLEYNIQKPRGKPASPLVFQLAGALQEELRPV